MSTAKEDVRVLLDKLPDDCSLEDVQYHLYVVEKIHRGIERAEKEGVLSQDEAERKLNKWTSEVKWSPEAIEDLESITEYIARDSEYYARAVVTELLSASGKVREFPLIGRVVPEIGDERIRERFIYSLVYLVEPEQILIVAVIHGKRLLENVKDRIDNDT